MSLPVLVVGAGPSGLTMALDLARRGVPLRLIDKAEGPAPHSRAVGVQSGCLRALEAAFGKELPRAIVAGGWPVSELVAHLGRKVLRIPIEVPAPYAFLLICDQTHTEGVLRAQLQKTGVRIEYATELVGLEQNDSRVLCTLQTTKGQSQLEASYVIGCDGAHSFVRHASDVGFLGMPYVGDFILADVTIDWAHSTGAIHTFATARGTVAAFPLGADRHRLIVIQRQPASPQPITEAEFELIAQGITGEALRIDHYHWLTRFSTHHRIAKRWRQGRAFLVGDAAHIHSPAGGQGMNTGIQDALVLAPILCRVFADAGATELLDAYERERVPVARQIVRGTDVFFRQALGRDTFFARFLRTRVLPILAGIGFIRRRMVAAVAQLKSSARVIAFRGQFEEK